jgi:hypothetical protein
MFRNSKAHQDSKVNKTDSVFYFNANIYNDPTPPQSAKLARFSQSISSGSVVDLPENYYLAIVRFAISHMLIPLYQFKDDFYSITIETGTGAFEVEFLNYSNVGASYSSFGYNQPVFYYSQFLNSLNAAIQVAHTNLVIAGEAMGPSAPYFIYNTALEKFQLYMPEHYYQNNIFLSMNANLFQQIQLIEAVFNGYNSVNGKDYTIVNGPTPQDSNLTVVNAINFYLFTQEKSALYLLNEVQSIVFTSTSINVTKEFIGKNDGQGNVGSLSIIADFVPDQSSGRDLSEYQYNVQGPPRLVNLTNTIPITEIDYQVGIRFRDGTIVPLYLEPGETCEVKFGFFKKSLYDNSFEY